MTCIIIEHSCLTLFRRLFIAVAFILLLAVAPLMSEAQVVFPEFLVNTTTADRQFKPAIADDAQGRFVVAWTSNEQDGDGLGVFARLYDAQAQPRSGEFQVNSHTANAQFDPSVAMADGGRFIAAWESAYQDGYSHNIYGQRFNSDGIAMGNEFRINMESYHHQQRPDVACDAYGDFAVVWDSDSQDGSGRGVFGRLFDRDGNVLGDEFQINTHTSYSQQDASIGMDRGGYFVVVWRSDYQDGSGSGIYGRRFDDQGNPLTDEFLVNTSVTNNQTLPSVAMDATGAFVAAWMDWSSLPDFPDIYAQRFNPDGSYRGSIFIVASGLFIEFTDPDVSTDQSGNFFVTYSHNYDDAHGRLYGSDGQALTAPFILNYYWPQEQSYPVSVLREDGSYVATWQAAYQDGDGYGIIGRLFNCSEDSDCDDGLFCNGLETCSESTCVESTTVPCPDDGMWCTGDEFCDEDADQCASTGDPCDTDEICDEDEDECVGQTDDDVDDDADDDVDDDVNDDTIDDDTTDDDTGDDETDEELPNDANADVDETGSSGCGCSC